MLILVGLAVVGVVLLPNLGNAPTQPNTFPIAPHEVNIPEQQEVHGATSAAACQQMERTFILQGRNLRLKEIRRNDANKGGGVLTHLCVFEGTDAQDSYFQDRRYETESW
ncbi:hypothetical protein ACQ4M4_12805 [Leptolyngbya sp. AN02str]|uniref:hypothetical protein n=1 Tax=Leptolyngbya sp. AN02str TaxID=3423363 RepID=UPI003D317D1E